MIPNLLEIPYFLEELTKFDPKFSLETVKKITEILLDLFKDDTCISEVEKYLKYDSVYKELLDLTVDIPVEYKNLIKVSTIQNLVFQKFEYNFLKQFSN